ncbi:MAG: 30S ribosomal protein S16 [Chloroflexi bacterium]|nr:30S ribosomal protein S16 [Chloroflexota bacterium]
MLKIRLTRRGKKRQPIYRVVVMESGSKRDGRYVENLGVYNPLTNPETVAMKEDRALYWLSVGAQPTDPVRRLLKNQGTFDRLARLHKGESLEALVAEFEGRPWPPPAVEAPVAPEKPQTIVEKVVEVVSDAAEAVVETVTNVVADDSEEESAA